VQVASSKFATSGESKRSSSGIDAGQSRPE
jgi:hypothetical protein